MNNLRNNNLAKSSVTLPAFKPIGLTGGAVHKTGDGKETNKSIHPINFINNLSSNDQKVVNMNIAMKDPWGNSSCNNNNNVSSFNANFEANFEEAFSSQSNESNNKSNGFNEGFANFESVQKELVPSGYNGLSNCGSVGSSQSLNGNSDKANEEDRYAALKDLDQMFKARDSPVTTSPIGNKVTDALLHSNSVPANLSSSSFETSFDNGTGGGWFNSNQINPFSQGSALPSTEIAANNGWVNNFSSSSNNPSNFGSSPSNPFFNNAPSSATCWQPDNKNSGFSTPSQQFTPMPSNGICFSSPNTFHQSQPLLNPFFPTTATPANPRNPFI